MPGDASAIAQLMHTFDIDKTLEGKKALVKVDDQTIIKTDLSILPKEHMIFELTERSSFSTKVSNVIESLMDQGFEFAITHLLIDDVIQKRDEAFLARFKFIVFNVRKLDFDIYHKHEILFRRLGSTLVATKVETQQGFDMCKRLGFSYFLGYFFEQPRIIKGKKLAADKITLMQVLTKLRSDEEIGEIIKLIKYSPDVSLLLLKFINAAGFSAKKEVDTITQAVNLLGRQKLTSWVMLTLFTAKGESQNQPLVDSSLMRARMMELLCDIVKRSEYKSQAYMVGLLSLSDAIFKVPMRDIVDKGFFSDAVAAALINGEGELGKILKLALIMEQGNFKKIEFIAQKLKLPIEHLSAMFQDAFTYVREVKKSMQKR